MFSRRLGSSHPVLRPVSSFPVLKKRGCGCKLGAELPAKAALLLRRSASASLYLDFESETVKMYAFSPSLV